MVIAVYRSTCDKVFKNFNIIIESKLQLKNKLQSINTFYGLTKITLILPNVLKIQ